MHLKIDIDLAVTGDPATEVGRILRYWAGAAKQLDLTTPHERELSDSEYKPVGTWRVSG